MGSITNMIKAGASQSLNQFKNYDINGKISKAVESAGINIPEVEMPEATKNIKLNIDPSVVKPPAGLTNRISPLVQKAASLTGVKLPSEIGGVELPTMPDLSSVTSKVDEGLSKLGFDTNALGIRSVDDILKNPDFSSLYSVPSISSTPSVDIPDVSDSIGDSIDMESLQSEIDKMYSDYPGMEKIDISKYF